MIQLLGQVVLTFGLLTSGSFSRHVGVSTCGNDALVLALNLRELVGLSSRQFVA